MQVDIRKRLLVSVVVKLSATVVTKSGPAKQADYDGSAVEHSENPVFCEIANQIKPAANSDSIA